MSTNDEQPTMALPASNAPVAPRRGGAVSVIALILALAALGLAGWAAFRPTLKPAAGSGYSASQQADAKASTCAATELVRKGVSLNTNLQSPGGDADVTGSLAVAANARLSLSNGGQYLINRLDPATPTELAADIRDFGNTLMDIGAASIAGALNTDPDQAARLSHADALNVKITEACK
jgi:hypothetical protein